MTKPVRRLVIACLIVVGIVVTVALIVPAIFQARAAAQQANCHNHLRQIGQAMQNHADVLGTLPIGIKTDDAGVPVQSWRTSLYPTFMESAPQHYDRALPWDSPENKRLINGTLVTETDKGGDNPRQVSLDPCPDAWRCPSADLHNGKKVGYAVVIGEQTAFPLNRAVKWDEITDGLENTILVVETNAGSPFWTEPIDLHFDSLTFAINGNADGNNDDGNNDDGIASFHAGGVNVCFADGETCFLTDKISAAELRALLTIAGGEPVTRQDLLARGILR